jgi:hypothetical protein
MTVSHQARWVIRQHRRCTGSGRRWGALRRRSHARPLAIHVHRWRDAQDALAPPGRQPARHDRPSIQGAPYETGWRALRLSVRAKTLWVQRLDAGRYLGERRAVPLTQVDSYGGREVPDRLM